MTILITERQRDGIIMTCGMESKMKKNRIDQHRQNREELMREIETLQQSLETANSNFENVSDPDLIDSYIYEMNAISFRYKYLLKQMRNMESCS